MNEWLWFHLPKWIRRFLHKTGVLHVPDPALLVYYMMKKGWLDEEIG